MVVLLGPQQLWGCYWEVKEGFFAFEFKCMEVVLGPQDAVMKRGRV